MQAGHFHSMGEYFRCNQRTCHLQQTPSWLLSDSVKAINYPVRLRKPGRPALAGPPGASNLFRHQFRSTIRCIMLQVPFGPIVLWEHDGVRCTFQRRESGPPYEVVLHLRDRTIVRVFEHDEDASTFAINAMKDGELKSYV